MITDGGPSFTVLLDWVEGRLDESASAEVQRQVADSPEAQEAVDWIREFHRASRAMPLTSPPTELGDRLRGAFRERLHPWAPETWSDARLDFDTRVQAASGIRSARDEETFDLGFRTEDLELLLTVTPVSAEEVDVRGSARPLQTTDKDPGPVSGVVFTSSRRVRRRAVCDATGEFDVSGLPVDVDEVWVNQSHPDRCTRVEVDLH